MTPQDTSKNTLKSDQRPAISDEASRVDLATKLLADLAGLIAYAYATCPATRAAEFGELRRRYADWRSGAELPADAAAAPVDARRVCVEYGLKDPQSEWARRYPDEPAYVCLAIDGIEELPNGCCDLEHARRCARRLAERLSCDAVCLDDADDGGER